ncbi:MAG TPA: xanthine dehydrogenase accessory protein XdhC [Mesorhizobium sp.]|jgi:xanthine dehydrogenase accessory factor|nr:xanthine dehydrogenase accessory protein XdhC [Mesorhizobium sp.]
MSSARALRKFLAAHPAAALVEVSEAKGSTPREAGAWMLVSPDAIFGTIGGGQLEFLAIAEARRAIAEAADPSATPSTTLDIPLGPEIGQCCGGRVSLGISSVDDALRDELLGRAAAEDAARPHVYLFGAGHVGHALAWALSLLPVSVAVVEMREETLAGLPETVEAKLLPLPEQAVREAPPGSAFVILTHDHALDFLLAAESLKRGDATYIGMIGSKTKRNTFRSWFLKEAGGTAEQIDRLVCPIGGSTVRDKRPAVIAALTAAEIMTALAAQNPFSENPAPA